MNPIERILTALRDYGHEPRKAGAGWCCKCPAHDDRNPSLSIHTGDDGRALVNCHAGCTVDAVCTSIGLRPADLFISDPSRRNGHAPRTRPSVTVTKTPRTPARNAGIGDGDAKTFPTARDALAELERRHGPRSTTWTYTNAAGEPVGLVVRWNRPPKEPGGDPSKEIQPVSKLADGWAIKGMPTPRPLYGLPALLAMPTGSRVYVTEGEKAAEAARAVGLVTTTSPHGSKSAGKADWSPVAGREVVILPDHDEAGKKYADDVARLATAAGAKSVRVVHLVDLWGEMPRGGDMADLVENRGGEVDPIRAEVEVLADNAEAYSVTPNVPAVPEFTPFPADVLPEPIRGFVTQAAKAIGCDASYIALPMLSGLASAIGNTHRIELKRGWTEPPIVWTAIVGESGTAKSPALELALRPIRNRQHDAMKAHAEAMREYDDVFAVYDRDANQWRRTKSVSPPPAKPEPPIADRCWTDDATTEALAVLLNQNPRGLLMVRDELAGWFNFDRYAGGKGGGDAAKWLEMHGGRAMVVDRKGGGTLYVPRAAVSIAGGIQPETLRRALGVENTENGLASRLLMACPPKRCPGWTDDDVSPATEAAVAAVFDKLFALTSEMGDDGDEQPRLVTLAPDGQAAAIAWVNWHASQMMEHSGPIGFAWAKLKGYAARLALVVHLTRWAAGDTTLRDPARVDEASIAAGVVLARWFGDEARRVYAILSESETDRETRRLVEWIERKGGAVTVRDLTHGMRAYRGDPDSAERALSALVEARIGRWEADAHGPKGGRPAQRFRLVSTVTVTETPANTGNDVGYGDGDTGDTVTDAGDGWGVI